MSMLVILTGLPGTGKTTLARALARDLHALHLRIDSVEGALQREGVASLDDKGYRIAYAIAEDNLKLGLTVVADSVNPIPLTREAWADVAKRSGVRAVQVEIVCSDRQEHRRRVESRKADIDGLRLPTWQQVLAREYVPLERADGRIDTAGRTVVESSAELRSLLAPFAAC